MLIDSPDSEAVAAMNSMGWTSHGIASKTEGIVPGLDAVMDPSQPSVFLSSVIGPKCGTWLPLEKLRVGDSERILLLGVLALLIPPVGVLAPLGVPRTVKTRLIVWGVGGTLGRRDDGRAGEG